MLLVIYIESLYPWWPWLLIILRNGYVINCPLLLLLLCVDFWCSGLVLYRDSYMSAHVLSNLLNEARKRDKMQGLPLLQYLFFATCLIILIIQELEC